MPSRPSPSSPVQAARQALADRLKEIRVEARLSATELAEAAGWYGNGRVSKIEHGVQPATAADIEVWCQACGAADQIDDLTMRLKAAEGAYVEWRRLQAGGLKRLQESYVPLFERTQRFRWYDSLVVPGLLQTPGYAEAILARYAAQTGARPDVAEAAAARVERQRVLYSGRTFAFVVEEAVLRNGIGGRVVMAEQLAFLAEVAAGTLPSATLGVVPFTPERRMWPVESFSIFDGSLVDVESLTARITVAVPGELSVYVRAFETLSGMAVYDEAAVERITAAVRVLQE